EYPQIELVQIQFNYLDYEDIGIQSRLCYEVCEKHGKPVVIMEPVKGGLLANLPVDDAQPLKDLGAGASQASYAIRFAASFPQTIMVLSGMSTLDQMRNNLSYMADFKPLSDREMAAVKQVAEILNGKKLIACTGCRYCTDGCPMQIPIPDIFADLNAKSIDRSWNSDWYFSIHIQNHGKPSECIECGQCEGVCPQQLPIIQNLKEAARVFEKKR
ncbi:MAG: 4Fe-4S dicluster domain-containing protein, partial [Bacteroidales bacterium]|nr:4Fe-4S dicluster domain-containing protein [Bacteroidales bacterium]